MAERVIKKVFDNTDKIVSSGYLKLETEPSKTTFLDILNECDTSIILVDTKGDFIKDAIIRINEYSEAPRFLVIGLVNRETLLRIRKDGIKDGFYRSTDERFGVGLIITNKKNVYAVLDINNIYPISTKAASKELFEVVNHVLWSKTEKELFGTLRDVKELRLSVIAPEMQYGIEPEENILYDYATNSLALNCKTKILPSVENGNENETSVVMNGATIRMFGSLKNMCFEVYRHNYYSFVFDGNCFDYESFKNKKVGELVDSEIIVSGKKYIVQKTDAVEKEEIVLLDEFEKHEPDFEKALDEYKGFSKEVEVSYTIKASKLDGTYKLSNRYSLIRDIQQRIDNGLKRMEKFLEESDEWLKRVEAIREEKNLSEKIRMFNQLAEEKEFGVEALNNKKSPISPINVNEDDLKVPNELIGKLWTKQNNFYLATSIERLGEAKEWLKENKVEAFLIEA